MKNSKVKQCLFVPMVAFCAVLVVTAGCSKKSEPQTDSAKPAAQAKPAEVEPPPPPGMDVFSNFDDHNKFDKRTAWAVMNSSQAGYRGQAEWFAPKNSGQLNFVDVAMSGKGTINVTLTEDNGGIPGKAIENFSNISSSRFGHNGHLILVSKIHPTLNVGVKYWLCVEPASAGTGCSWFYNNQNLSEGFALDREPGSWSSVPSGPRNGAFRINILN